MTRWWLASAAAAFVAALAGAEEVSVQNDSLVDGGTAAICPCFAAGEEASSWLTSPCNGNIVAVQIFWKSLLGGTQPSIEDRITVHAAGNFPTPGPLLQNGVAPFQDVVLVAPLMTDGFLNEFRFLDENMTVPIQVAVVEGEEFVVSFRFFNSNEGDGSAASLVADLDGCQPGKNGVFAIPGGWLSACLLGVSGDWVIRAVVDCDFEPGACCLPDGTCQILDNSECTIQGGIFLGQKTTCDKGCPDPVGGCCFVGPPSSCNPNETQADCELEGGFWLGPGSICNPGICDEPGACCFSDPDSCADLSPTDCDAFGGVFAGPGTDCGTFDCNPMGGCCLIDGTCTNLEPAVCSDFGGDYQGDGSDCGMISCPDPMGACCNMAGTCAELTEATCNNIPGATWIGPATTCDDANKNGTADACEPDCPADVNGDSTVDVLDLIAVITGWGGAGEADIDNSGVVDVLDLIAVITAWGPC